MVVFNPTKREIGAKIVYYGPALCGKTTNIQYIHKKLNPNQRGELVSLATKDDRTLFFDFLPLDLGKVKGFNTRFHLYTVPGQVYYVSTRRAVLTGVDGIIFVADLQEEKLAENIESLEDLEKNLLYYGKNTENIPMVLQYNKCDLENLSSIDDLNKKINKRNLPCIQASAVTGKGVMETLTMICKIVLQNLEDGARKPRPAFKERPPFFAPASPSAPRQVPPQPSFARPPRPADQLIELESDEEVAEIERLKAERRATIDRLLKQEIGGPVSDLTGKQEPEIGCLDEVGQLEERGEGAQEFLELRSPEETEEVSVDVSTKLSVIESLPEDLEKEEIEPELELPEEALAPEGVGESIQPLVGEDLLKPQIISKSEEVPRGGALEIVSIGEPQKVLPGSIKLPFTIRISELDKEAKITVLIQLEELIIK